ncbi:MAG: hypothetical protein EHM72_13345 [Calditrichaeota bacterium]|nr:MAG: hypothetical protein EHM72_13345 [Calditrichota bacterium]
MKQIAFGTYWVAIALLMPVLSLSQQALAESKTIIITNTVARSDTDGNFMDVHDGCLEFFDGIFYLYGTRYGKTDGFTKANRYVCYSSADLAQWRFHGEILTNPPEGIYYRPYVKFCAKTKKYVLWYNWYPSLWNGQYGVATSDSPAGPFVIHNNNVQVKHAQPGDLGLLVDDGVAYLIYTSIANKHGISIEKLSDDYLSSTMENSGIIADGCEACAMFKRNDSYYALFDGTCCFCPGGTGARVYTAKSPLGPYTLRGNINRETNGKVIVPAQQTHIAEIPGPEGIQYVWMGDLWGSCKDGIKGHDLQYWSGPLQFDGSGLIETLVREDSVTLKLPNKPDAGDGR